MPPRTTQTKTRLADLSDEERAALLAELEEQRATETATIEERKAAVRTAAIAELLDDRDHLRGCPGGRVEMYAQIRPAQPSKGRPAVPVTVVRCIECGGTTVVEHDYDAMTERLADEIDERVAAQIETEEV